MATITNSYKDRGSTCVSALKNLYVAMGGELTDTYDDIAGGDAVSTYVIIPDCVNALSKVATSGGGGSIDFSTAEVTLILTAPEGVIIEEEYISSAYTLYPEDVSRSDSYQIASILADSNHKFQILLYKDNALFETVNAYGNDTEYVANLVTATYTGGVELDDVSGLVKVTGDGTITATLELATP